MKKNIGFANREMFSQENIQVSPKDKILTKKNVTFANKKKVPKKIYKFCQKIKI